MRGATKVDSGISAAATARFTAADRAGASGQRVRVGEIVTENDTGPQEEYVRYDDDPRQQREPPEETPPQNPPPGSGMQTHVAHLDEVMREEVLEDHEEAHEALADPELYHQEVEHGIDAYETALRTVDHRDEDAKSQQETL